MIGKGKIAAFCVVSAVVPRGGGAPIAHSGICNPKAITESRNHRRQWRSTAIIHYDYLKFLHW